MFHGDERANVFLVDNEEDVLVHTIGDNRGLNDDFNRDNVVENQVDQQKDVGMNEKSYSRDKIKIDTTYKSSKVTNSPTTL